MKINSNLHVTSTITASQFVKISGTSTQALMADGTTSTLGTAASYASTAFLSSGTVIPAAQVNADWNATSGLSSIKNKPTIPVVPTSLPNPSAIAIYGNSTSVVTYDGSATKNLYFKSSTSLGYFTVGDGTTSQAVYVGYSNTHYTSTWSVYADSTLVSTFNQSANRSITFKAGSNITLNATANSGIITISGTGDTHYASTFTVYGDNTSVATFTQSANMTLSIVGGDNITLTKDATNHKITISGTPNTTYGAQSGITLTGGSFGHTNTAITAGTTQSVYSIKYDAYGHITSATAVTIPAAQVNTDWNATSGVASILNKPEMVGLTSTDITNALGYTPIPLSGTTSLSGNIIPTSNNSVDLGASDKRFRNAYLEDIYTNMIYPRQNDIGIEAENITIEPTAGYLTINGPAKIYASTQTRNILPETHGSYSIGSSSSAYGAMFTNYLYAKTIENNTMASTMLNIIAMGNSSSDVRLNLEAGGDIGVIASITLQGGSNPASSVGIYLNNRTYGHDIVPLFSNTYDLGSISNQWNRVYGSTIYAGNYVYTSRVVSTYSVLISGYSGVSLSAGSGSINIYGYNGISLSASSGSVNISGYSGVSIYASSGNITCVIGSNSAGLMIENYSTSYATHPVLAGYVHTITFFREMSGNVSQTYYDLRFSMLLYRSTPLSTYSDIMYALNSNYNIPWNPEGDYLHYDYLPINGVVKHYVNNTVSVYHATGLYMQSGNLCYIANEDKSNFTIYVIVGELYQSNVYVIDHVKMLQ